MKRTNLLFSVLTLFLGMTLGCMLTLTYIQQADLERCGGGQLVSPYRLSTASNSRMVDREIKAIVSLNQFEREGGLERLGCVCGEEAKRLKEEVRRVRTTTADTERQQSAPATAAAAAASSELHVSTEAATVSTASHIPQLSRANPHKCTSSSTPNHQGLLVAIFTSSERINRSSVAYDTWGMDVSEVVMFVGNDTAVSPAAGGLPLVTLSDVEDRVLAGKPRKLFRALSYLHQHYSERYQWFLLVSGEVYVHGQQLEEFLGSLDPTNKMYIGYPASGRAKDSQRLKLLPHEQYCMGGPGVVLSQAALKALYPHLDKCLGAVEKHNMDSSQPQWYNEDVELGRCISRNIGVQCSASIDKAKNLFYEDYTRESQNPATLWGSPMYRSALTVHPVVTTDHMHTLHHYYKMLDYQTVVNRALAVRTTINELCSQLSLVPPHPAPCRALLSNVEVAESVCPGGVVETEPQQNFYPRHRYHIESWKYFDPQFLYTDQMDFPSYKLRVYRRYHHELQKVLLEVVNVVNRDFPVRKLKIKRFTNGYVRHDSLYGNEYIIDGVFEELGNPGKSIEKRVHLRQLLASNYVEQEAKLDASETIHFIVPVSNVGARVTEFMEMYEKLSLENHENTHLVMVAYSNDDYSRVQDRVNSFQRTYPSAKFTIVRGTGDFSRAKAMEIGISILDDNDLAFFCDVDMLIQREFLTRCRRNTIQGKIVYYPEFFKLYNMDYVYFNSEKPKTTEIKRKNGHWAYYSFGMACIYKCDYRSVGGFDTGITGWGDEDVELYEKILRKKIKVFRAPDTALTHRWHQKICSEAHSTAKQYKHCLSSQGENLADRIELAQYILQQEEHQTKESRIFL